MRSYLFTGDEKKILNTYVKRGHKVRHFNIIMMLIRRNQGNLERDVKMMNIVVRKMSRSKRKLSKSRSRR